MKLPIIKGEKKPVASIPPEELILSGDHKYINPLRKLKKGKQVRANTKAAKSKNKKT